MTVTDTGRLKYLVRIQTESVCKSFVGNDFFREACAGAYYECLHRSLTLLSVHVTLDRINGLEIGRYDVTVWNGNGALLTQDCDQIYQGKTVEHTRFKQIVGVSRPL